MCRDSTLPIDLFEGEGVQHVPHLLLCDKEAAYTIHSPILHHQLLLIGLTQFFLCLGTVLFAEIVCFHLRMSSVISGWLVAQPSKSVKELALPRCASLTGSFACASR